MKELVKDSLYAVLKRPAMEALLARAYSATSSAPALQRRLIRLTPQPYSYKPEEERVVVRQGLRVALRPANYFQWHQFYGLRDEVMMALRALAEGGEVVFDVGANIGFYSLVVARTLGPGGRVFSLEPHPENVRAIEASARSNQIPNVTVLPIALGERTSQLVLRDVGKADLGKFSLRDQSGAEGFPVSVRTLDDVVAEQKVQRLDLLKVDVEGHEPEVFIGARKSIERFRPKICVELSPKWYADRREKAQAAFKGLEQLGYAFYEIVTAGLQPIRMDVALATDAQRNLVGLLPEHSRPRALNFLYE